MRLLTVWPHVPRVDGAACPRFSIVRPSTDTGRNRAEQCDGHRAERETENEWDGGSELQERSATVLDSGRQFFISEHQAYAFGLPSRERLKMPVVMQVLARGPRDA